MFQPQGVGQLRRRPLLSLNCLWQDQSFGPVSQDSRTATSAPLTDEAGSPVTGRGFLAWLWGFLGPRHKPCRGKALPRAPSEPKPRRQGRTQGEEAAKPRTPERKGNRRGFCIYSSCIRQGG